MNNIKYSKIYKDYINTLLKNQNDTDIVWLQDIYKKKDYEALLKKVLYLASNSKDKTLKSIRYELYKDSNLDNIINDFVNKTEITPGIILDYGTFKTRDMVIYGNRSEVEFKDGKFIDNIKPIEADTIFDLASTSKIFTALSILKLDEDGLISVFDPVIKYVPKCTRLENVTIYDLLKFRVRVVTDGRVDSAKNPKEALDILYTLHPIDGTVSNSYTDMGAMVLRILVENVTHIPFYEYVASEILDKCGMKDTYLNVPEEKIDRVANENYSTIINKDGHAITRYDNFPGTPHDPKAVAIGESLGIAPGHAGFFSTTQDMVNLGNGLCQGKVIKHETLLTMSETATGFKDDKFTRFYGSLVYLKQPDPNNLSVYPPLSGRSFMSPGFAGTQLVIDPLNNITLFVASPRLHNRIYQVSPNHTKDIIIDEAGKKSYILPNGEEKIVCSDYTKEKEILVTSALNLALQYQLLEKLKHTKKEMHLVREL